MTRVMVVGISMAALIVCGSDEAYPAYAAYGRPEAMQWKDGKRGAFTMQFDDSTSNQADVVVPLLEQRGLVATFFVNPGAKRYRNQREVWESLPARGHELANHTWDHGGAPDLAEAEREIGGTSEYIWQVTGHRRLLPFDRGGGTYWGITEDEMQDVMQRHCVFQRPTVASIAMKWGTSAIITTFPQMALDNRTWVPVHLHDVVPDAPDTLATDMADFLRLLDFLVAHRADLWVATTGAAYRYQQEYQALSAVELTEASREGLAVALECDVTAVESHSRPFGAVYDEPLTVRVQVPAFWSHFSVTQAGDAAHYDCITVRGGRVAQFGVVPNVGLALVRVDRGRR